MGLFPKGSIRHGILSLLILALCLGVASCAQRTNQTKVVTSCDSSAASGTLNGRWPMTAVPVAYHTAFTQNEMTELSLAVQTWNSFASKSAGYPLLNDGSPGPFRTTGGGGGNGVCSQSIVGQGGFTGAVSIYKQGTWGYTPEAIAITTTCPAPANPFPLFFNAAVEINFQYFFHGINPHLQSIVLHEYGHLLGLRHSCENNGVNGMPNCFSFPQGHPTLTASLYPIFSFDRGQGETRVNLNENDMGRANCLYTPR